jgi:hypothetical protein
VQALRLQDHRTGVEANDTFYCCANCARHEGAHQIVDHA